jgi:hypothetical protein
MTADASEGLTRYKVWVIASGRNLDLDPDSDVSPTDQCLALLADLRGKLADEQATSRGLREVLSRRGKSHMPLLLLKQQLEAERAKVREATELLQEAYDYGAMWRGERICKWVVEDDQLPASVDAKGEAK